MGRISLVHETAWSLSRTLVGEFGVGLCDEERIALFRELYRVVRPELLKLLVRLERENKRLAQHRPPSSEPPLEMTP